MWVAVILGAWLVTSLLIGPWIGRFIATHASVREEASLPGGKRREPKAPVKPMRVARRA